MNQDDDTGGVEMRRITGQGTEDGMPVTELHPSNESNQRGTASGVWTIANSQGLFGVTITPETRNVLLVVIGIFASACVTAVCNMPAKFLKENYLDGKTLQAMDVISDGLPNIVYLLVFNSSLFMTCMAVIVILGWGLRFKSVLLFFVISASLVYIIIVNEIMPGFRVRIGKSNFSSIALMWLSVVAFILLGIATLRIGRYALYSIWSLLCWLRAKSTIHWRNAVHWVQAKTIHWRNTLRNWST